MPQNRTERTTLREADTIPLETYNIRVLLITMIGEIHKDLNSEFLSKQRSVGYILKLVVYCTCLRVPWISKDGDVHKDLNS